MLETKGRWCVLEAHADRNNMICLRMYPTHRFRNDLSLLPVCLRFGLSSGDNCVICWLCVAICCGGNDKWWPGYALLATRPKGSGYKPGQGNGRLRAIKIRSTPSLRWEVMPEVPCRKILRHTLCRRSLSKCYLRIQSVPQREHHTSPLQRSTG
jgi:hypothetical protein